MSDVEKELKSAAVSAGGKEPQVLRLKLEVTDAQNVNDAVSQIEKEFGKLDVVINNAAVLGGMKLLADTDPDEWWQTCRCILRSKVIGTVLMTEQSASTSVDRT